MLRRLSGNSTLSKLTISSRNRSLVAAATVVVVAGGLIAARRYSSSRRLVTEDPIEDPETETSRDLSPSSADKQDGSSVVISNMDQVKDQRACSCYSSFSGDPELVEFYLPQMSMVCTCGVQQQLSLASDEDPLDLVNILRPWQVTFLDSLGIHTALEFLRARRDEDLAKALKKWRKREGYGSVRTKMCQVALHIWAKPCLELVEKDLEAREGQMAKKPSFLDASMLTATSTNESEATTETNSTSFS